MHVILKDLRWLGTITALAMVVAVVTLIAGADRPAFAATFTPAGQACLDNETTTTPCDGSTTAGATSGISTIFTLPKGDANFAGVIGFTPPGWTIPSDADVPNGALVGSLTAQATLGLISGACSTSLRPTFPLMDATTSASATVTFDNGFLDGNSDGLPDAVTSYPDFLTRVFPGQTPRARLYGQAVVGGINVSLNFLIFEPGTTIHSIHTDAKLGYPSVTVLQNIGDPNIVSSPNAITDFCSPLVSTTTTFGTTQDNPATSANEGGVAYRKNAADGTYNSVTWAASQRDADGDGIENGLDTCPFTPDSWDPRVGAFTIPQAGDADGDRVPDSCDRSPNDANPSNDIDADGYLNTGDNCPQDPNGIRTNGTQVGPDNQKDTDSDGIGDQCDQHPTDPDGVSLATCVVNQITVGAGGTADAQVLNRLPCGAGVNDSGGTAGATPTPVGQTPGPVVGNQSGTTTSGTGVSGPAGGIGTLSPVGTSIPAWAALAIAIGGFGLLGGVGTMASRRVAARRKRQ